MTVSVRSGAICQIDDGLLLVRHGPGPAGGEWNLPEVALNAGEALAEAVVRAVSDLAGLEVVCGPFVGWNEHPRAEPPSVELYFQAVPVDPTRVNPSAGGGAAEAAFVPRWKVPELRLTPGLGEFLADQEIIDTLV